MAAFNWIVVEIPCPACSVDTTFRCQVHVASSYGFSDHEYRLGERMAWWPPGSDRYEEWAEGGGHYPVDERCTETCDRCHAEVFIVLAFRDLVPERVVLAGREGEPMQTVSVEWLTPTDENYTVIRMPGRQYPGAVFNGDSLDSFVERIRALAKKLDGELAADATLLLRDLEDVRWTYEAALSQHGIGLPYPTGPTS